MNWRSDPSSDERGPVFMDSERNMRIISRARDLWTRRRVSELTSSKLSRGPRRVMSTTGRAKKKGDKAKLIAWHVLGFAVAMSSLGAGIWWLLVQEAEARDHHLGASALDLGWTSSHPFRRWSQQWRWDAQTDTCSK